MSGHSKWSTIKHKKGALDAKRGKLFSKLVKEIIVAAKMGGGDLTSNPRLRLAVLKAKASSMPSKNIDNAIKKGTGDKGDSEYFEVTYEGYGPQGSAIIVDCLTDNKNRTVATIRSLFSKNGGSLGTDGSVAWQFEKKSVIRVKKEKPISEEQLMELALDIGAEDVFEEEENFAFIALPKDLSALEKQLTAKKFSISHAEITQVPKNTVLLTQDKAQQVDRLMQLLEDAQDVQTVFSNHVAQE